MLDTNVFMAAFTGPVLARLLANRPQAFVSGPTLAELSWTRGRLDPGHPGTAKVLDKYDQAIATIDPLKILTPGACGWEQAGELAGTAARAIQGGKEIRTAFDRIEPITMQSPQLSPGARA